MPLVGRGGTVASPFNDDGSPSIDRTDGLAEPQPVVGDGVAAFWRWRPTARTISLLAASLSFLVACGGGLSGGPDDAADGGRRDGPSDRVTQQSADARREASVAGPDAAPGADARADTRGASDAAADARADRRLAADAVADVRADGPGGAPDASFDTGPVCTLGTAVNCAACGDPACALENTLTACTSADRCGRAVCAAGFGNCNVSSLDCEATFTAGATCLPHHLGTNAFATDYIYSSWTTIGTDGSFFLAGSFRGTVDFDPTGAHDVHSAASAADIANFITKLNADGSYAWTQSFPEPGAALGAVAPTADGGVVAVGVFYGSIDLDPGPGVDLHQSGPLFESYQALVVKLAADGSLVWGRTLEGTEQNRTYSSGVGVAVDAAGAVYMSALFVEEVDFDPGPGMALRAAPYVGNAAVVKLTSAGDFAWVQTIGNGNPNCRTELWALTVGTDGTVWGAGWAASGAACQELGGGGPGSEPLVVAFSAAGEARGAWALPPATQAPAYAWGVAPGPSGSVYVGGSASGLIDLDPGPGVGMRWAGSSQTGGFLVKLASDASLLWAEGLPGISVNSLAATGDGGVLLGGYGPNAVVARVGPNGTPDWTFATGGPTGSADSVAARGSSFVVVGASQGSGDFDPGPGTQNFAGDIRFLSRFDF